MNPKLLGLLAAGLALLAGLFVALRPGPPAPPAAPAPVAQPAPATEVSADLVVHDGKRASGPELIQARQGQELRLRVTSDRADELHLHGYDLQTRLAPGATAELRVPLKLSGRFEIELHHAHGVLAVLEVQPNP